MSETAVYGGIEYEIRFSGRELLCVPEPETPKEPVLRQTHTPTPEYDPVYQRRGTVRDRMFTLMATKDEWAVKELRIALDVDPAVICGLLLRGKTNGLIESRGYGRVALKQLATKMEQEDGYEN
jgi:hypothetical protein